MLRDNSFEKKKLQNIHVALLDSEFCCRLVILPSTHCITGILMQRGEYFRMDMFGTQTK